MAKAVRNGIDQLPPHSPENEQAVLGCIFQDPNTCLPVCIESLTSPAAFYDLRHQTIYDTLVQMFDRKTPIDMVLVYSNLKDRNLIQDVGGLDYLSSLPDAAPSAVNLPHHLQIVRDKWMLRKMIVACTECVGRIYDCESDVAETIDGVERDILRVRQSSLVKESTSASDLVRKAIGSIEDMVARKGSITGLATGFIDLDKMTWGLQPGDMAVIAARPSVGKTSLAMNIAEHVAVDLREPVGIFTLEMTPEKLMLRMVCSRSRVNMKNVREGFVAERDYPKLAAAARKLATSPIYIEHASGASILQLRAKARRMWQQHGIKLFVIDYLQLLSSTSKRAENRQQEIADISCGIKALAMELMVPVLVLSQLNRELERDKNRKPRLADIRESGAIEQDADLVGLLYKPNTEEDEQENPAAVPVHMLIAKQREGEANVIIPFTFMKPYTRFESAAKISQDDYRDAQNHQADMDYRPPHSDA